MQLHRALFAALALAAGPLASARATDGEPPPDAGAADPPAAPRMADFTPPRFGADRRRAVDPAHDVGLLLPRADTVGEGRTGVRGTMVIGGLTVSHGVSETVQVSLTGAPAFLFFGDRPPLPLIVSAKWAFVRRPDLVVSVIGTMTGITRSGPAFGPTVGILVDRYVGTRLGLHASALQLLPVYMLGTEGVSELPFTANLSAGGSLRLTDWLFAIVGVNGEVAPSDTPTVFGSDLALIGGLRISGTRFSIDGGVIVADGMSPILSWTWRN